MSYTSHPGSWDGRNFNMNSTYNQQQGASFADDDSPTMYTNMASIQGSPRDALPTSQPRAVPNVSMTRWAASQQNDPYYPGKPQATSAPVNVANMFNVQQFRNPPPSDCTSSVTGPYESSYAVRPHSLSVGSVDEPSVVDNECPVIEKGMKRMKPPRKTHRLSGTLLNVPVHGRSRAALRRNHSSVDETPTGLHHTCMVPECGKTFKLQSELKKHSLKHDRPFKCTTEECPRSAYGFTTVNDLNRHKTTKHGFIDENTKAWRCSIPNCRSKPKDWYRLDNFRQHIFRQHAQSPEEIEQIVSDSVVSPLALHQEESQNSPDMAPQDMASDQGGQSDMIPLDDYAFPEDYDMNMMLDEDPLNTKAMNWGPGTPDQTSFLGLGGHETSQTSYPPFSDVGASSVDRSSYGNAQPSSPSSFTPGSSLGGHASSLTGALFAPNISPIPSTSQPSWPPTATTSMSMVQGDDRPDQKDNGLGFASSPQPKVVLHQPDKRPPRQELPNIMVETQALLRKCRTEDEFRRSMTNLLQLSNSENQLNREPLSASSQNRSRDASVSSARSRPPIINQNTAMGDSHDKPGDLAVSPSARLSPSSSLAGKTSASKNSNPANGRLHCPERDCEKVFVRQSALDKHVRRHQKPYGCTFDDCRCKKIFGSKNDWKRHENSQHMQQDAWRCEHCYQTWPTKRLFATHLEEVHLVTDREKIAAECKPRRIGVNHSGSFWCGFCREIIPLDPKKKGVAAWDDRFNHIAAHFVPEKGSTDKPFKIEEWLPPDGRLTKGEKEANNATQDDDTSPHGGSDDSAAEGTADQTDNASTSAAQDSPTNIKISPPSDSVSAQLATPSPVSRNSSTKRKRKGAYIHTCCQCDTDYAYGLYVACVTDGCDDHHFCIQCVVSQHPG